MEKNPTITYLRVCLKILGFLSLLLIAISISKLFLLKQLSSNSNITSSLTAEDKVQARAKATLLLGKLTPGITSGQMRKLLFELKWWPDLVEVSLNASGTGEIVASTPFEISATNWIVTTSFLQDSLESVTLGTLDCSVILPSDVSSEVTISLARLKGREARP